MFTIIQKLYKEKPLHLGFAANILLIVISFLFTTYNVKINSEFLIQNYTQQTHNTKVTKTLNEESYAQASIIYKLTQTKSALNKQLLLLELETHKSRFNQSQALLKTYINESKYVKLLNQLENKKIANQQRQDTLIALINDKKFSNAQNYYFKFQLPRSQELSDTINKIADYHSLSAFKKLKEITSRRRMVIISLVSFLALTIFASLLLARKIIQKQNESDNILQSLANTDSLTMLANRPNFISAVDKQIEASPETFFSVIFLDIDHFKGINDTYGHAIGDKVLKEFTHIVQSNINEGDVIARFGGDEFVLLLKSKDSEEKVLKFIKKLSKKLDTSIIAEGNEIFISSSLGICTYPNDANNTKSLLKYADIAMFLAKQAGRNTFKRYSREDREGIEKNYKTTQTLHSIINKGNPDGELFMKYQPLYNIKTETISECEALIRWIDKDGISIATDDFIPLAEKTNLIEKINLFVINEVCLQQKEWQEEDINNIRININLSGNKVIFSKLLKTFVQKMKKFDLDPSLFGIELTERTLFDISDSTLKELQSIRDQGIKISIDDFGTGYSSLSYLKKLPITTLKIDKAFIDDLPKDEDDQSLVKAIISLGHSLKMDIVAEGVETLEQYEFLKENGCNTIQGYYFHHPLISKEISELQSAA